ncbi:hypothetical protein [uncultured Flavobacterium sp.]|uniref:hypothetical protein n=1 Tax=uncultured Flavobacterium sp. TaxID=165435 RepID=UPI00260096FE|nr:hypothetical protein [uncultured Flavobacterium sp.]
MARKKKRIGTILLSCGMFTLVILALIIECNDYDKESPSGSSNPFGCSTMKNWSSDEDVINALKGTWVMENEDYYGKYKIQFSGRTAFAWKMEEGGNEWKDYGNLYFEEIKKYEHVTKMNQGPEYLISFKSPIGTMKFEINCIGGLVMPSDRYKNYGIAFIKQ